MKKANKNLLSVGGIIAIVLGLLGAIPSFLTSKFGLATGASILVIAGIIMLAIAFED